MSIRKSLFQLRLSIKLRKMSDECIEWTRDFAIQELQRRKRNAKKKIK